MIRITRTLAALAALSLTAACAVIPDAPRPETAAVPQGTPVAIGQAVTVGTVVATPMEVVEDSRCPINARCVWAGRLVVKTRIDGAGWRDTADLTLGEDFGTHNVVIALTSGSPAPETGREIAPEDYRFTYEAR
jgi:hypothetical protein